MMVMLNDTFSKLSTAMVENKSQESKSEWPKFSGVSKKFRSWYLAIMAQISLPPWAELYEYPLLRIQFCMANCMQSC